jgi:hypothetical protein
MSVLSRAVVAIVLARGVAAADGDADEDDQPSEATALFARGRELIKAGKPRDACPLFEHSLRLAPALGTELNLALCWAATGRLVDALHMFETVEREASAANQPQREQLAREGKDQLVDRIPTLTVALGALPADTIVELDGKPIAAGMALSVDPGEHRVEALGARRVRVTTAERHATAVMLELVAPYERPIEVWAVGGAAAAALLIGTITGITALHERDAATGNHCHPAMGDLLCDQRGVDLLGRAHTMAHVTTGLFVAGLGAAGVAVYLELQARKREQPPLVIGIGPEGGSVSYAGKF